MKPTTEGSKNVNFDVTCISFGKGKEKGLEAVNGAEKSSILENEMEIKVENSVLMENGTLKTENGNLINFGKEAYETVKENNKARNKVKDNDREIR